jgi:hypothetical protein
MKLGPAKNGAANPKFWEASAVLNDFLGVKRWLGHHHSEVSNLKRLGLRE